VNELPGTAPKGSATSSPASAVFDNAKHARHHHFGDVVTQFEANCHSFVTMPSGAATIGLRTSVRCPVANDTRHEHSG
jgi:hypothetical protein